MDNDSPNWQSTLLQYMCSRASEVQQDKTNNEHTNIIHYQSLGLFFLLWVFSPPELLSKYRKHFQKASVLFCTTKDWKFQMPAFLGVLFLALTWLVLPVTPQLQAGQGQGLSYSLLVQPIPIPARFGPQLLSPQVSGGRTLQTWALRSVISCPVTSSVASRDARVGPALVPALPPLLPFVPLSRIHATGALQSGGEQETKADREVLARLIPQTHLVRGPECPREPLAEPSLPSTT